MNITKLLKKNILAYKKELVILIALNIMYLASSITIPYMTGHFIDILTIKSLTLIKNLIVILVVLAVIEVLTGYFRTVVRLKYKTRISSNINYDVIEHIKRVPLLSLNNENKTYLTSKIAYDSEMSIALLVDFGFQIIIDIITFMVACIIIGKINIRVLLYISSLIPIYILLYFVFKNPISKTFKNFIDAQSKFFATQNEQLSKMKLIKISSKFNKFAKRSKNTIEELVKSASISAVVEVLFSKSSLILSRIALIILFIFGSKEVISGNMTIGEFIIINTYFNFMISSIESLIDILAMCRKTTACLDRLETIVSIPTEVVGNRQIDSINSVELKDVYFGYDENKQIIHGFNYKFETGNIYAMLGSNGKGKSTLIDLLIGLIDNYDGDISVNCEDIKSLNLYKIREELIGYTEQEPDLINGTLLENIYLNIEAPVNDEILNSYIESFNLQRFIRNLPEGLNTYINTDSNSLSGGEKQKISIIRTLLKNPNLIIFDEPTSALDKKSIENFKGLIKTLKSNKIIIIITHDYQLLDICDEKIEL